MSVMCSLGGWRREEGYLYTPTRVPWWPYYPGVYGRVYLPGWTSARSWATRLVYTAAQQHGWVLHISWGSTREYPVGREPFSTSGS